mgnify:CR=1 FL=1
MDLRATPRIHVSWPAACAVADAQRPPWPARVVNLSDNGLGLLGPCNLPRGTVVELQLAVPPRNSVEEHGHTMRVRGRVAQAILRQEQFLLGIQLLHIGPDDLARLQRWLRRSPEAAGPVS